MWMLKDLKGNIKYLMPNKVIKVGRKDADIVLENDSSISRAHATITVTLKEHVQTSEESSTCLIKDNNSKYGSFIVRNDTKLKVTKEGLELHNGDTLTFGLQNCTYSVKYIHLVTVVSRLSNNHKQKLKSIMDEIGGLIIDFYNSYCTHLTASTAHTTTKTISALISGVPIVGIDYWIQVRKCVEENKSFPDANQFVLSLQDAGVDVRKVSLQPNPARKTLFQNKTFIFFTEKSYKDYKEMIQQAGGTLKVLPMTSSIPDNLFSDDYIIMKVATNDSSAEELIAFDTILQNKMKEKRLRSVNETEIPLAIIYACLDQYCNPKFDFTKLLKRKGHVKDTSEVLALDTQEVTSVSLNKDIKPVLIPESIDIHNIDSQSEEKSVENNDDHDGIPVQMRDAVRKDSSSSTRKSNETSDSTSVKSIKSRDSCDNKEALNNEEKDLNVKKERKASKRQRETSELDEIDRNNQGSWPSKRRSSQMFEENDYQESMSERWGFKKSNKKVRDFDLDLMDLDEPKNIVQKNRKDVLNSPAKEHPENFDLDNMDVVQPKKVIGKSSSDVVHKAAVELNENQSEKRKKKAETIVEAERDLELRSNIQLKVKPLDIKKKELFIKNTKKATIAIDEIDEGKSTMSNTPLVISVKNEVNGCYQGNGKIFKKKYNDIPIVRVPLAEMTVWRPN